MSILEALGQGMNQPAPYLNTSVDALPPGYGPFVSLPGLAPNNPTSLAQFHQGFAGPIAMQPASNALMSQMLERFGAIEMGSHNDSAVYGMGNSGQPYLPEIYQAPGDPMMGPLALPPEHIAAWQAAWLQQPQTAASNTYQG